MLLAFLFFFSCAPLLGVYNYQVEEDISKLKLCVNSLLQEYNLNVNIKDDYVHELYVMVTFGLTSQGDW